MTFRRVLTAATVTKFPHDVFLRYIPRRLYSLQKILFIENKYRLFRSSKLILNAKIENICSCPTFTLKDEVPMKWAVCLQNKRYSTLAQKCWKCGKETDIKKEYFFCECGIIQEVSSMNYFEIFGMKESYDVDLAALSSAYKKLQIQLHPDKFSLRSQREQELAEEQSSYVSIAYHILLRPLPRALYMLQVKGKSVEEDNTDVDQEFLLQIMETNEEIIEAEDPKEFLKIETENQKNIKNCIQQISDAFKANDIPLAKMWTVKLKYFNNIDSKIKEVMQISFDK